MSTATVTLTSATVLRRQQPTTLSTSTKTTATLFGLKPSSSHGRVTMKVTTHKVTLVTPKGKKVFNCPTNETILDYAMDNLGLDLPFTCKAGACSSCVGKVVAGKVDQSDGNYLDDEQMAKGWVLTCVAYPKTDVTIETHKEMQFASLL